MITKTSSTIFSLLFLLFIFAVIAFLETGKIESNDTGNFLTSYTEEISEVETISNEELHTEESVVDTIIPVLESKLVNSEKVDGYLVEEYREYEIYMDESGKTIKSVPTANYQYVRYKIYE